MNVAHLLTRAGSIYADRPAVRYQDRVLTYAELDDRVRRMAAGFARLGLEVGDRIMLFQRNQPALLESHLAALRAGMVSLPLNFRLHPEEAAFVAADAGARLLIHGPEFAEVVAACQRAVPGLVAIPTGADGEDSTDYRTLLAHGTDGAGTDVDVSDDHPAWLFYTSGTTGRPKGAIMAHRVLWAFALNFAVDIGRVHPTDVFLHSAPLTHGSGVFTLPGIAGGACHVIQHGTGFDPALTMELIAEHQVTHLPFLAPTMVNRLVDHAGTDLPNIPSLRTAIYGGAPMYAEDARRAIERFGPIWVQVYGQGEAPTISRMTATEYLVDGEPHAARLTSVGQPRVGVQVRITDVEGMPLSPGETGEIRVRGPVVMNGYWNQREATQETLAGGWLRTGDQGHLDADGFLHITGRLKDLIISGGMNIYPREVEDVLLRHPAVRMAAVIGVPDEEWGETVRAVIVLDEGASASDEELLSHCRSHLASYRCPRSFVRADELPTNAVGKVAKMEVAALYG
jgi:acyl-CoA synthetase (AMP-forming)/AMP-acid ligase II